MSFGPVVHERLLHLKYHIGLFKEFLRALDNLCPGLYVILVPHVRGGSGACLYQKSQKIIMALVTQLYING